MTTHHFFHGIHSVSCLSLFSALWIRGILINTSYVCDDEKTGAVLFGGRYPGSLFLHNLVVVLGGVLSLSGKGKHVSEHKTPCLSLIL